MGNIRTEKAKKSNDILFSMLMAISLLLAVFAVILQPNLSLFTGLWKIQVGHAGLITDPICTGGPGAALLNAALMLCGSTLLVRLQKMPFTGLSVACLYMMAGFALLGKNVFNSAPIVAGSFLYSLYKGDKFSKYVYLSLFGTCLSPMVSYFMLHITNPWHYPLMVLIGLVIGFVMPAIAGHTVRLHQGYNLYNVGVSAGFVGLALVSILKGFGVEFHTETTWSTQYNLPLCIMMIILLLGLLVSGVAIGCRSWKQYKRILGHSGRAVADFFALEGIGTSFVNMALVGAIGLIYLQAMRVPLNGPLVCCLFAMIGFGCFGKHPKNVVPVMAGAIIAAVVMKNVDLKAPGVLLATLLCTGLAPVSGQFGWYWGIAAGFVHMSIVQNTSYLHGGLNLYNNGFAAGLTCVIMIPLIEALKREPEE
ncbi:MAG: DUF1576 domain-containing protein [Clostridia bacterium]|nr:DUF1576 domain-containing protein [Clostridia bacterium]